MDYRELYCTLSQGELKSVAMRARLTIEDIRQEARLWCWQIARGESAYDSNRGSVRQFVMAKLWGLAARQTEIRTVSWTGSEIGPMTPVLAAIVQASAVMPSVLESLIVTEERREEMRDRSVDFTVRSCYVGLSSTAVLLDQGISSGLVASLTGVTPQAVRQRVARERARRVRPKAQSSNT
jgi:hypothetical protein